MKSGSKEEPRDEAEGVSHRVAAADLLRSSHLVGVISEERYEVRPQLFAREPTLELLGLVVVRRIRFHIQREHRGALLVLLVGGEPQRSQWVRG